MRHEEILDRFNAFLIAGPTASGKSALAIRLAEAFDGSVINADSMQIYGDLRILTARPTQSDEATVPHELFGHVDGAINYSLGLWLADAGRTLARVREAGRLPIFVGGTGLYFKALTQGVSEIPPVPEALRQRLRAEWSGRAPEELHAHLATLDPLTAAGLRPTDPQRLLRALEVLEATGSPLASFQGRRQSPMLDAQRCLCLFIEPDRRRLDLAIAGRFDAMLGAGALKEVARLASRGLDPALPIMRAHGVPALMRHLAGEITLEEAARQGKLDTRHYAKRQFTFARHQLPAFQWVAPEAAEPFVRAALVRG